MDFYPAIDIRGGKCVRLLQGDYEKETVYGEDPVAMARRWESEGAQWLHVVDLDGAREGVPRNRDLIKAVVEAISIPVELGGGIRDVATARAYLEVGVRRVIVGSILHKDPETAKAILGDERCAGRVGLGIDAKGGKVAVAGWEEITGKTALEFLDEYARFKPPVVVYTDIGRDGMMSGPNLEDTAAMGRACKEAGIGVILSGGVSSLADVKQARTLADDGVIGVISGRAIYEGKLDVAAAVRELQFA